jgi:hypothetical protein
MLQNNHLIFCVMLTSKLRSDEVQWLQWNRAPIGGLRPGIYRRCAASQLRSARMGMSDVASSMQIIPARRVTDGLSPDLYRDLLLLKHRATLVLC